jgi:hypothetical protein
MTNDELLGQVLKLTQLTRQYFEISTQFAQQTDAKIRSLELEIEALRFSMDWEARMRAEE